LLENHELEQLKQKKYLTIGEVAQVIDSSPNQIRKWERMGQMPKPATTVQRGSRIDRVYTWPEIERMIEFRRLYKVGAPTAEEARAREKIKEQIVAGAD
jgi:DNA-binding transcriptional MerR regulator